MKIWKFLAICTKQFLAKEKLVFGVGDDFYLFGFVYLLSMSCSKLVCQNKGFVSEYYSKG